MIKLLLPCFERPWSKSKCLYRHHPPSSSVIAKIFSPIAPPAVPKSLRTREWLIDYGDDDDDESHDESINNHDLPPPDNVKFLPTTIEGLRASFEELIKNIAEDCKSGGHEKTVNRNEAVFLLDELKNQGGIILRMYRQYNNFSVLSSRFWNC